MTYQEILSKKEPRILITGSSLSFNRYDYDPENRGERDVFSYGAGLPSWSFSLRDRLFQSDPNFIFGDALEFDCDTVPGIENDSPVPFTAMFGGRIQTLHPSGAVTFSVPIESEQLVLYLQRRIDAPCVFDICVDGELVQKDVDTQGDASDFAGYSLMLVRVPCQIGRKEHTVTFSNIRGEAPKITVAGVGSRLIHIALSGRGGQCIRFFVENFEQRIAKYAPDLILITLTGNDRIKIAPEVVRQDLIALFSMIFGRFPACKVLFLLPTSSHDPADPDRDVTPYTSKLTAEAYNRSAEKVCKRLGKPGYDGFGLSSDREYDIEVMRISSLFDDADLPTWRFDNIHLTKHGNQVLLNALWEKIGVCEDGL